MNMYSYTFTREDRTSFAQAAIAAVVLFSFVLFTVQAYADSVTLTISVQQSLTFTTANQGFASGSVNITPGTPLMATTTLSVTTNNVNGWNITLSGDNKSTTNNNLQRTGDTTVQITDQTEWIPPVSLATSSAGNAAQIGSFVNSGNVLAFRVAASSTNGSVGTASAWWGSADNYASNNASTLYAGIASSTNPRVIINPTTNSNSYSASAHLNDVQYYLNVSAAQKTGEYTAALTYTATAN